MTRIILLIVSLAAAVDTDSWLSEVPDVKLVNLWMLPGTHQSSFSGSLNFLDSIFLPWLTCQSMTLEEQLEAGVRFVDLRLATPEVKSELVQLKDIYDSRAMFGTVSFQDTLDTLQSFLTEHETEFIMLYIRRDYDLGETLKASELTLLLHNYIEEHRKLFLVTHTHNFADLRVRDVQGKIILLSDRQIPLCYDKNSPCLDVSGERFSKEGGWEQLVYEDAAVQGPMLELWDRKFKNKLHLIREFLSNQSNVDITNKKTWLESVAAMLAGKPDDSEDFRVPAKPSHDTTPTTLGGITLDSHTFKGIPQFIINPLHNRFFLKQLKLVLKEGSQLRKLGLVHFDFIDPKLLKEMIKLTLRHHALTRD